MTETRAAKAIEEYNRTVSTSEDPFTVTDLATCHEIGGYEGIDAALKVGYMVGYEAARREAAAVRHV